MHDGKVQRVLIHLDVQMNVVPGLTAHYRAHAKKSLRAALTNSHRYVLQNAYEKDGAHTRSRSAPRYLADRRADSLMHPARTDSSRRLHKYTDVSHEVSRMYPLDGSW